MPTDIIDDDKLLVNEKVLQILISWRLLVRFEQRKMDRINIGKFKPSQSFTQCSEHLRERRKR